MDPYIDETGRTLMLGCLPRVSAVGEWFTVASDKIPPIPRNQLVSMANMEAYRYCIEDQNGYNACAVASCAIALEDHQARTGRTKIRLDWLTAWKEMTGGRNTGVAIDVVLQYITTKGLPVVGSNERLVVTEAWDCEDVDSFLSGMARGALGVWGRFIGRGGHAEHPCHFTMVSGKAVFRVSGSWGETYGTSGFYDVKEAEVAKGLPSFGAYLIRETALLKGDVYEDAKS
jgi:hypothetical protein